MASRIVWWVLTLGILAVFYISMTKENILCRYNQSCFICKYTKANKYNCLVYSLCFNHMNAECIKYERDEEKRTCGIPPPENIVGGSQTNEGNWPWHVSLQTSSFFHICGGVLIDNDWVLTAAHCVHGSNITDWIVVLGEFDLKLKSEKEQLYWIKHIFVHPNFHPGGNYPNDVALIQLENATHYSEYVSPVCLPSFNDIYPSNSCSITGWGDTTAPLRVREVTLLAPDECEQFWSEEIRPKHHICVNYGQNGACTRDDGGLLSCIRSSDGRFVVAGVVSWGHSFCGESDHLIIYANIRKFVPWINNIMHSTKEKP